MTEKVRLWSISATMNGRLLLLLLRRTATAPFQVETVVLSRVHSNDQLDGHDVSVQSPVPATRRELLKSTSAMFVLPGMTPGSASALHNDGIDIFRPTPSLHAL